MAEHSSAGAERAAERKRSSAPALLCSAILAPKLFLPFVIPIPIAVVVVAVLAGCVSEDPPSNCMAAESQMLHCMTTVRTHAQRGGGGILCARTRIRMPIPSSSTCSFRSPFLSFPLPRSPLPSPASRTPPLPSRQEQDEVERQGALRTEDRRRDARRAFGQQLAWYGFDAAS